MYKKVLVIGSGPIVIGQAAEFDYSGTQACRVLKEEHISVVLVNNNPATIMTDKTVADAVYSEPLNVEFLERIIKKEKPDALIAGMGGQTALNLSMQLSEAGILEKYNVEIIGTSIKSIETSEDRELFKAAMASIDQPSLNSEVAMNFEEARYHAGVIGYPIVVRPAFTLGGTGGGFCHNDEELKIVVARGLAASRVSQVLIEKSIKGWKELEYEMIRDHKGNTIVVCNMENLDPVGVHTGDSIVVAPSQSLTDGEYQMLRTACIKIVDKLNIVGGCNVQLALSPTGKDYYVIEVNPRVSRSSALASKATGYPIAKVATRIALGYALDEIMNDVTKKTKASFEPALDYCALKIPKWPFNKFKDANRYLSTQMKATGEVMAIANNFESALLKGIRSLEINQEGLVYPKASKMLLDDLFEAVVEVDDERIFFLAELLRRGVGAEKIKAITGIDLFFILKVKHIVVLEELLKRKTLDTLENDILEKAKILGFSDVHLKRLLLNTNTKAIKERRVSQGITPVYKMVDTCAGEFDAISPYFYSTYDQITENTISVQKKVVVVGSGPIAIGQGVEFDYCSVHSILSLQKLGYEAILINNNPETVSTDFDLADKLYFEPITFEDVMHIIEVEKPVGVILQFGGQTAIKLAKDLSEAGVQILGTSYESIHLAEDRASFNVLMDGENINRPRGFVVNDYESALEVAKTLEFPLLVRPSYVIGGEGMSILYSESAYVKHLSSLSEIKDLLIDQFLEGIEIEVDCITDGQNVFIPGIMEHIEKAGVHSGDSISVYPTQTIGDDLTQELLVTTEKICVALKGKGLINIQYIYAHGKLYVIEVNPRASRTVPFLSKVTNVQMIDLAVRVMMGETLKAIGCGVGIKKNQDFVAVKTPIFSMEKINNADVVLSPEMKSTGELLSIGRTLNEALKKSMVALSYTNENHAVVLMVSNHMKEKCLNLAKSLDALNYQIYATKGTQAFLKNHGIESSYVGKIGETHDVLTLIAKKHIDMVINIPTLGYNTETDGFRIRRASVERHIPCYTNLQTIEAKINMLKDRIDNDHLEIYNLCEIK